MSSHQDLFRSISSDLNQFGPVPPKRREIYFCSWEQIRSVRHEVIRKGFCARTWNAVSVLLSKMAEGMILSVTSPGGRDSASAPFDANQGERLCVCVCVSLPEETVCFLMNFGWRPCLSSISLVIFYNHICNNCRWHSQLSTFFHLKMCRAASAALFSCLIRCIWVEWFSVFNIVIQFSPLRFEWALYMYLLS